MSVRRWIVAGVVVVAVTAGGLTYHGRTAVTSSATCSHSGYSRAKFGNQPSPVAVSYTHLTLPTNREV